MGVAPQPESRHHPEGLDFVMLRRCFLTAALTLPGLGLLPAVGHARLSLADGTLA